MSIRQRLTGLVAILALVGIVAGLPALLLTIGANPIPTTLPGWNDLVGTLTAPDDGSVVIYLFTVAAWLAWAFLAVSIVVEVISRIRGIRAPQLPGLRLPQGAARGLVGAAALLFVTTPLIAHAQPADRIPTETHHQQPATTRLAAHPAGDGTEEHDEQKRTHVVQAGESLWSIAEKYLGDGDRYREIAKPNYGRPQADGHHLTRQHWLNEGWVLELPDRHTDRDRQPQNDAAKNATTRTVREGDTLWSIAEETLGDGNRYPAIFKASRHVEQPGGYRITDPDEISAGWTVVIPDRKDTKAPDKRDDNTTKTSEQADTDLNPATDRQQQERPSPERRPSQPRATADPSASAPPVTTAPATTAPTQTPATQTAPPAAGDTADDTAAADSQDEAYPVRTAAGVGSLLAAGVIGLVAARRVRQQRHRRQGARLPMPEPAAAHTEQQLRAAADPLSVETVDIALRELARGCAATGQPLPAVRAARLTPDQFDLYLAEDAELPEPWTGTVDATVWTLTPDSVGDLDPRTVADVPAPYPALVTIGHDTEDGHVFLDLEHIAALNLAGDRDTSHEILAAIAIELATSTWADDLQVTLVGAYPELEDALQTGRIRYVPTIDRVLDELRQRADQDRAALHAASTPDLRHARVTGAAPDSWNPEIVLIAGPLTDRHRSQLADLLDTLPRVAIAAVTTEIPLGEWRLDKITAGRDTAILEPVGLTVRPQRVDADSYAHILDMVATANDDPTPAPTDREPDPGSPPPPEPVNIDDHRQRPAAPDEEPDTATVADASDAASTDTTDSVDPRPHDLDVGVEEPAEESADVQELPRARPIIRVLGPVDLENAAGTVEQTKRARLLEYAAYLASNPGATPSSIDDAIWPNRASQDNLNTRNTATSKLRKWLGENAAGEPYLPRHSYTYADEVDYDWTQFNQLVGANPATASTQHLERALALVRGRPYDGVHPRRYSWAEPLRQEMISAVVDAAYELAHRRLMDGRWRAAEEAVVTGLSLEPGIERLWRLRILAAHEARNRRSEQEAIDRMLIITDELGGDLEPETEQLLAALKDGKGLDELKEAL